MNEITSKQKWSYKTQFQLKNTDSGTRFSYKMRYGDLGLSLSKPRHCPLNKDNSTLSINQNSDHLKNHYGHSRLVLIIQLIKFPLASNESLQIKINNYIYERKHELLYHMYFWYVQSVRNKRFFLLLPTN